MTLQADIVEKILRLPEKDRAELARQLLLSLEPPLTDSQAEVDAAWEAETERRCAQIERGEVAMLDWRESIERIRA